jgi:hypothetical protein
VELFWSSILPKSTSSRYTMHSGKGSNMKAEIEAMWTLLFYANLLKLRKVQVFGTQKLQSTGKQQDTNSGG